MYGPFKTFVFEKGKTYDLPVGYHFSGDIFHGSYKYAPYEYVGPIEQISNYNRYLVFQKDEEYVFCAPAISIIGDKLEINMNPRYFGPLKEITEKIGTCKWDLFCTEHEEKDMPSL